MISIEHLILFTIWVGCVWSLMGVMTNFIVRTFFMTVEINGEKMPTFPKVSYFTAAKKGVFVWFEYMKNVSELTENEKA